MTRHSCFVLFAAGLALVAVETRAEEVRYYEQNGVTYREVRRVVEERIPETKLQDCTRTVYREQVTCENKDVVRTYWLPVTDCHWQTRWINYGNPFAPAYQVLEYVPTTRWESRTECVKMPVECRRMVPEVQTVQTPVTSVPHRAARDPRPCGGERASRPLDDSAKCNNGGPARTSGRAVSIRERSACATASSPPGNPPEPPAEERSTPW